MEEANITVFTYFTEIDPVSTAQSVVELLVFTTAIVSGVIGNLAVIVAVACEEKMHSATNYLIASQAASDLLYLTVVPVWAANRWLGTWPGGDALCKVCVYAQYVTSTVSIWNMCAIAVERLRSISRNRGTAMSGPQVAVCSAILWVVSLALNVVHTLKTSMQMVRVKGQELRYCEADSVLGAEGDAGRWMTYALSLGSFLGPVGFLVFIYSKIVAMVRLSSMRVRSHVTSARNIRNLRLERRLLLMLVLSALLFFLMWLPSIVANTLVMGDHHHLLTPTVVTVTAAIGAVNMSVNPVLLLYFNNFFRDSVRRALRCACCRARAKWHVGEGRHRHGPAAARATRRVHPVAVIPLQEERNARENQASSSREQHDSGGAPPDVRRTDRMWVDGSWKSHSAFFSLVTSSLIRTSSTRISESSRDEQRQEGTPNSERRHEDVTESEKGHDDVTQGGGARKLTARSPCVSPVFRGRGRRESCSVWTVE